MYSYKTRVLFSEVDSNFSITLPAILTKFQDCSIFHSESVGLGVEEMIKEGHVWFLSSWQIIINRYPKLYEELTNSTWAYGWRGFYGFRNFKLEDAEGNMAAYANTNWVYTDLKTGHPAKIPKEVSDAYQVEAPLPMEVSSRKIPITEDGEAQQPYTVRRSDMDSNRHVNNVRYVQIAGEYLPEGFVTRQLRAEYKQAAHLGDTLYPHVLRKGDRITTALTDDSGHSYAVIEFTACSEANQSQPV